MDDFRRLVAGQDKFAKLVEDAMGPAYALSKQLQAVNGTIADSLRHLDFDLVGTTIAGSLKHLDFDPVGSTIADSLKHLDFDPVGSTIADSLRHLDFDPVATTIAGSLKHLDFDPVGTTIADSLKHLDFDPVGTTIAGSLGPPLLPAPDPQPDPEPSSPPPSVEVIQIIHDQCEAAEANCADARHNVWIRATLLDGTQIAVDEMFDQGDYLIQLVGYDLASGEYRTGLAGFAALWVEIVVNEMPPRKPKLHLVH
jgi:phosphoribosylformylglycinamidine (FGAM) synthase PurS component